MDNELNTGQPLTKKERKALRRAEKEQARTRVEGEQTWRRGLNWFLTIFTGALVIWGLVALVQSTQVPAEDISAELAATAADWHKGSAEAPATLIEYGDFQCPACGAYHALVSQLMIDFPDQLNFVYRHFPLTSIHTNAMPSALAAEAAGEQGKFWEMYDLLYTNQSAWAQSSDANQIFKNYAKQLGLDETKFAAALGNLDLGKHIDADVASGNRLKINSTPTFFLNGKQVSPRSYDEFKSLVSAAVDETPTPEAN